LCRLKCTETHLFIWSSRFSFTFDESDLVKLCAVLRGSARLCRLRPSRNPDADQQFAGRAPSLESFRTHEWGGAYFGKWWRKPAVSSICNCKPATCTQEQIVVSICESCIVNLLFSTRRRIMLQASCRP
jgi:hypothetical protein